MNKTTKTYQAIKPIAKLLTTGKVMCIDPSTGSQSSMPGYAYYEKGVMIESGIIEVDHRLNSSLRLYEIARTIREDFPVADLLIVEFIPPVTYVGGMNSIALMALQRSIGAIVSAHPYEHLLEIPASAWKAYKPEGYVKSDEWDAVCLGNCAITVAREILEEPDQQPKPKKNSKKNKRKARRNGRR